MAWRRSPRRSAWLRSSRTCARSPPEPPKTPPETASEKQAEKTPEKTLTIQTTVYKPPKSLAVKAQEAAIGRAIGGEAVSFATLTERTVAVRIARQEPSKRDGASEPRESFRLTIDGATFDVKVAKGLDPNEEMAKLVEYFVKVPPHLQRALKSVELEVDANPSDAYWAEVFGQSTFASAATAGGGNITFWKLAENPYNLSEGTFNHEMAHLIGAGYSTSRTRHAEMIPPGWEDAIKADAKAISDYGSNNANEDFSEAWRAYLFARRTPEMLKEFQEKYPNRARILEAIFKGEFDAPFKVGMLNRDARVLPDGFGYSGGVEVRNA